MASLRGDLLRLVRDRGPVTRTQAARELTLSRATVTAELNELERAGWVMPGPIAPSSGGRRSTTVSLGPAVRVLAVSLGEARVRAVVLDGSLAPVRPAVRELPLSADADAVASALAAVVADATGGRDDVLAAGLAVAPVPGWDATSWGSRLAETLPPTVPVVTEQSVRAMARGERLAGAARDCDNLVVVRLGATVTTAAYVDGHLMRGSAELAGAIGHTKVDEFGPACTCGSSGCLDAFVSLPALLEQAAAAAESGRSATLAGARAERGALAWGDLATAIGAGDPVVVQMARDVGRRVGEVMAALVAFANPAVVVLGGPGGALGPYVLSELRAALYRRSPALVAANTHVEFSAPNDRASLRGAAVQAMDRAFDRGTLGI